MSKAKAGKLLAKALDNSSKEEATTAFGMAFSYAERAGIRLSTIHRVEVVEVKGGSIDPDRERELVEKYNRTLARAKELSKQLEQAEQKADRYFTMAGEAQERADEAAAQLKAAGGNSTRMQELMDAAKELSASALSLRNELTDAKAQIDYLEDELIKARNKARGNGDADGYQLREEKARAEERERATYAELLQTRKERDTERQGRLNAEADRAELSVKCVELDEAFCAASIRRNNLARENQQQRDRLLQLEKEKAELQRQVDINKAAREGMHERNIEQSKELAAALADNLTLRATVSEQAEEIDALRSTRRALQIELDKHTESPLKKLFGW